MAIGLNPRNKRLRIPPATVGKGGGVGIKQPSPKPNANGLGGLITPPWGTFDPATDAQRRAAQRGLEDTEADVKTGRHFAQTNLHDALKTIQVNASRGREDANLAAERGRRELGYEEHDVRQTADRAQADLRTRADRAQTDFHTQLSNIARKFGELGQRQSEAANAAGVNDAGTQAASAAARGRNQTLAEEPIHTAQKRTEEDISQARGRNEEDLATALSRIDTGQGELTANQVRALKRLAEDQEFNTMRAHRETGQNLFELKRKLARARREGKLSNVDLLESEIWQARENHPGAFRQWSQEHPGLVGSLKSGGGGKNNSKHRRNP